MANSHSGVVSQVMGPVVDVRFDDGGLPSINNALEIPLKNQKYDHSYLFYTIQNLVHESLMDIFFLHLKSYLEIKNESYNLFDILHLSSDILDFLYFLLIPKHHLC